ncbi:hypothetical protein Stsp02_29210 [Streptomyces sp. NBRC 14336]|nr:hypothetical protein Stsp02_29210 [Streptomyces sp. NBRC 14336]
MIDPDLTRRGRAEGVVRQGRETLCVQVGGLMKAPAGRVGPPVLLPEVWTTRGSRPQTGFRSAAARQAHSTRVSGV